MGATTQILNRQQLAFLESNFVVYDPFYRECYQDFSGLENCQVILMGELHDSSILKSIQRKFLEIIIGNQPACSLVEGLTPGVTLNAQERAGWEGLPSTLQVRGADVRCQWEAAQFIEWERLNHRCIQLELADKELVSGAFRQIAAILNGHFRSNSSGIDTAKKVFLVTDGVLQAVEKQVEHVRKEKGERKKEIVKIYDQMNPMIEKNTPDSTIVRSNEGCFQEIEKASKQFSKVIAIWGKGHFVCGDELMRALDRARISYVILLPNAQKESEALDEIEWARGTLPTVELTVKGTQEELTLKVPKIFQSYFHPAIQTVFQAKTKEPIVLDIQKLIQFAKQGKTLTFPAGQPVHFEHAPLADYQRFQELRKDFKKETKLTEAQSRALKVQVISMLNNILMVGGFKVKSMMFDGSTHADYACLQNKLVLILSSDKSFHLTLANNESLGYAGYLFQEMKRLNWKKYHVNPQEQLLFLDLSAEEAERIKKFPNETIGWLNSKLPPQTHLSLDGQVIVLAGVRHFDGQIERDGIVLTTDIGFSFTLS
ncbi:MAG TPA: hypothetical protein VIJ14_00965 [Rhabdochlamydiaceae bacterium]